MLNQLDHFLLARCDPAQRDDLAVHQLAVGVDAVHRNVCHVGPFERTSETACIEEPGDHLPDQQCDFVVGHLVVAGDEPVLVDLFHLIGCQRQRVLALIINPANLPRLLLPRYPFLEPVADRDLQRCNQFTIRDHRAPPLVDSAAVRPSVGVLRYAVDVASSVAKGPNHEEHTLPALRPPPARS